MFTRPLTSIEAGTSSPGNSKSSERRTNLAAPIVALTLALTLLPVSRWRGGGLGLGSGPRSKMSSCFVAWIRTGTVVSMPQNSLPSSTKLCLRFLKLA